VRDVPFCFPFDYNLWWLLPNVKMFLEVHFKI
jgi:hypothetical protein